MVLALRMGGLGWARMLCADMADDGSRWMERDRMRYDGLGLEGACMHGRRRAEHSLQCH